MTVLALAFLAAYAVPILEPDPAEPGARPCTCVHLRLTES